MNQTIIKFVSPSSRDEIFCKVVYPESKEEALLNIIIVHDYFDYHKRYLDIAKTLSDKLAAKVCLYDQVGFGLSGGERASLSKFSHLSDDLNFVIENVFQDTSKPVIIIGNGLGGVVSLDFLLNKKTNGRSFSQILINPLLKVELETSQKFESLLGDTFKLKDLLPIYNVFHHNSNLEQAEKLIADPLAKTEINPSFFKKMKEKTDEIKKNFYFLEEKTLFLIGSKSKICDNYIVKLFYKGMANGYSNFIEYQRSGHELLFDCESVKAIEDILEWLKNSD